MKSLAIKSLLLAAMTCAGATAWLIRHFFDTHRHAPVNQKRLRNITSRSPAGT